MPHTHEVMADTSPCSKCGARGFYCGLFYKIPCQRCDGVGYVDLSGHWLDTQLRVRVEEWKAASLKSNRPVSAGGSYDQWTLKNRTGAGGYRGD